MTQLHARRDVDVTSRPLEWDPPRRAISAVPYLPALDGLRALAVVAVIIYHTNRGWLPGGFIGVEVFFVISGYLITLLIIAEHERTGRLDLRQFWIRRARRLLPALFFMLALLMMYVALFRRRELGKLRGDVFAGIGYVSNWYQIWVGQGYTAANDFAPLRHLWSLAVEEQYYLLWPLVMLGLMRLGRRRLPELSLWLIGAAFAIAAVTAVLFHSGPTDPVAANTPGAYWTIAGRPISRNDTLYLSTVTRSSGLLLGAAFAMLWRPVAMMRGPMRHKAKALDLLALLAIAGLGLLARSLYVSHSGGYFDARLFRGGFLLVGLATVALIPAATHRHSLIAKLFANPVFLWVGTRSYGLYLFHWPIYQILRGRAGAPLENNDLVIALVATLALTELSFRFVETPIRKRRVRKVWERLADDGDPKPRQLVALAGIGLSALLIFSTVSMLRADVRQNELEESLAANREFTTSFEDLLGNDPDVAAGVTSPPQEGVVVTNPEQPIGVPSTEIATTTSTTTTTVPPQPAGEQWALGDSVMAGAARALSEAGWTVDARESRQFKVGADIVEAMAEQGLFEGTRQVLVHLGTNGPIHQSDADRLFGALEAAGVPEVLVLTIAGNDPRTAANNPLIQGLQSKYGNVQVGYFGALMKNCQGDCFYDQYGHMKSDGAAWYVSAVDYWFKEQFS